MRKKSRDVGQNKDFIPNLEDRKDFLKLTSKMIRFQERRTWRTSMNVLAQSLVTKLDCICEDVSTHMSERESKNEPGSEISTIRTSQMTVVYSEF